MATKNIRKKVLIPPKSYFQWVNRFPLLSLRNEEQRRDAQEIIDRIMANGPKDEGELLYLDALSDLLATYEEVHVVIPPATDGELLRHLMDQNNLTQVDLHRQTRISQSTLSAILAGKKSFTSQIIQKLVAHLPIEEAVLAGSLKKDKPKSQAKKKTRPLGLKTPRRPGSPPPGP